MAKFKVFGNKKIYLCCERLFNKLYKSDKVFKDIINKEGYVTLTCKYGEFSIGSHKIELDVVGVFKNLNIEGFNYKKIGCITLSDVYKYDKEYGNLYTGGTCLFVDTLDCSDIVTFISDSEYISKEEVLIRKRNNRDWSSVESINNSLHCAIALLDIHKDYNIAKVFMRGDDLVLGFYSNNLPYIEYIYGSSIKTDRGLENLLKVVNSIKGYNINSVYWFIQDSYSNMRLRKVGNEYSLYVS